jgi:hypothetical protein
MMPMVRAILVAMGMGMGMSMGMGMGMGAQWRGAMPRQGSWVARRAVGQRSTT